MSDLAGKFGGFIIDMDGVLYRGDDPLPGARELFAALRRAGLSYILTTNNATRTSEEFSQKLAHMGINVAPEAILTSAGAAAQYLAEHYPGGGTVLAIGSDSLLATLTARSGFRASSGKVDFVVVGLDVQFSYERLRKACTSIKQGAVFVATNADATIPVEGGAELPGAGSIVAAIQTCSGREPVVIGKPMRYMADMALQRLSLPRERVLCVGDRLETDIAFGNRAGIRTALILTGVSTRDDVAAAEYKPDYIFDDLPSLVSALGLLT